MPAAMPSPRLLVSLLVLLLAAGAEAAEIIEPDRPDLTNSAKTVPPGAIQLETGVEYARTRAGGAEAERRLAARAALRVGLTRHLEVSLEGEPLVRLRGDDADTGHGDLTLTGKYRFLDRVEGDPWRPALALQPLFKVPLAEAPIGSERPDFGLKLLASFDLPWELALDVNAVLIAVGVTGPNDYLVQGLVSASLQRDLIPERLQAFVEVLYASREERGGRDRVSADVGIVYWLTRTVALDAAVETSLAGAGPDYVLRAGLSVRFGR